MIKSQNKIRSGALQFAVFVTALIALLLAGLILYAYTFGFMKEQSRAAISNIHLANNGIAYLLLHPESGQDTTSLQLDQLSGQTLKVQLSQWGIFQKAFSIAQHRTKNFSKVSLIGSKLNSKSSPTVYLQDSDNPLSLAGNTVIKGLAVLPAVGVRPAYISGDSYYGTELVYGSIQTSSNRLPPINENLRTGLKQYILKIVNPPFENFTSSARYNISQSFLLPVRTLYSADAVVLKDAELSGNIIVRSDKSITVSRSAKLTDVILCAPTIIVNDNVNGTFQGFATERIQVGKACRIAYPSALVLIDEQSAETVDDENSAYKIVVGSESTIKGMICYLSTNKLLNFEKHILLDDESVLIGQVYCEGNLEIKGAVSGSVYTRQFLVNQRGSIFINHLYNATLDTVDFPIGGITFEDKTSTVIKWLK